MSRAGALVIFGFLAALMTAVAVATFAGGEPIAGALAVATIALMGKEIAR